MLRIDYLDFGVKEDKSHVGAWWWQKMSGSEQRGTGEQIRRFLERGWARKFIQLSVALKRTTSLLGYVVDAIWSVAGEFIEFLNEKLLFRHA